MSQKIDRTAPLINRSNLPNLKKADRNGKQQAAGKASQTFEKPAEELRHGGFVRSILREFSAGREYRDDKSFKSFTHLTRALEKFYFAADNVDRQTGESEIMQGGLRRVDTELRKLFKGLGMPPPQAKQFSRTVAAAIGQEGGKQINFSLAGGAGSALAAEKSNNFQIAAIQIDSVDLSLNLRSGEVARNRTQFESRSVNQENTAALASFFPVAEVPASGTQPAGVIHLQTESEEVTAKIQSDNRLQEISRVMKQSVSMLLAPNSSVEQEDVVAEELFADRLGRLQQLVVNLTALTEQSRAIFAVRGQIRELRIEHADDGNHLRFTVKAQAPVGLTAIDETGHGATLYPRPAGNFGKVVEDAVKVTA